MSMRGTMHQRARIPSMSATYPEHVSNIHRDLSPSMESGGRKLILSDFQLSFCFLSLHPARSSCSHTAASVSMVGNSGVPFWPGALEPSTFLRI
jgi:hypothetical protein